MELSNERQSTDIIFDIDLTDEESKFLIEYGKNNISDEELVSFALRDILIKQVEERTKPVETEDLEDIEDENNN